MIKIRKMTITDFDETVSLWRTTEGVGVHDDVDSRDGIAGYLRRNPGLSFVAKENEKIVGAVLCGHDGRRGYLHHLAVAKNYRGQGIGKSLAAKAMDGLRTAGIRKCHIFVFADNHFGQGFWKKIGWIQRMDLGIMSRNTDCT